jgi:hypothetical protein
VAVMFFGKICPPAGPWPMPPWCGDSTASDYPASIQDIIQNGDCPPAGPWPNPPWCEDPENLAQIGEDTVVTFWVTVPYDLSFNSIAISIDNNDPVPMEAVGEVSYSATITLPGQQVVQYTYLLDGTPVDHVYSTEVTKKDQTIYDPILESETANPNVIVYVDDTWGRNYNMTWTEDTRKNIDSTFSRLADLGVKEIMVNDFYMAVYNSGGPTIDNLDYHIEGEVFENDQRDEVMTQEDLDTLAAAAHKYDMKIIWRSSYHMVNIGDYINNADIFGSLEEDLKGMSDPKTEAWVQDFLGKWQGVLVEKAAMLEKAGFDSMVITPGYHTPDYKPYDSLASDLQKETIGEIRQVYHGQVGAYINIGDLENIDTLGNQWTSDFGYYQDLDFTLLFVGDVGRQGEKYVPADLSVDSMKTSYDLFLDDLAVWSQKAGVQPIVGFYCHSIKDGFYNGGWQAPGVNPQTATSLLTSDWQHQADCVEALFQAIQGRTEIGGIYYHGFHWDDKMDPETAVWPISLDPSFRAKPGEAVFQKWMLSDWASTP